MLKILKWLMFFTISIIFVIFAMANRNDVELFLPIVDLKINLPLYMIFFANIIIGIFLSGIFTMKSKLKNCLVWKRKDKEICALKREISNKNDMPHGQLLPSSHSVNKQ